MVIILMGVSGSGKTTVGARLADELDWDFVDGDDFHPPENVEKMSRGMPLTDEDRWPWLRAIRSFVEERLESDESAVVACSALKQSYRDLLLNDHEDVHLVYLRGDFDLIEQRMRARENHFFDADLLASQFEALEEPASEDVLTIDIDQSPEAITRIIKRELVRAD